MSKLQAVSRGTFLCRYSVCSNRLLKDKILSLQELNMRPCSTFMHLLLRCMRGCGRHSRSRMPRRLRQPVSYIKLIFKSLYFNSLTNSEVVLDCILEPVFWMVEVVTRWFGMVNLIITIMLFCCNVCLFLLHPALFLFS